MSTENVGDRIMSHPMNDQIKERLYEEFHDMTILDFVAWLESHKDTNAIAHAVYFNLDSLANRWVKEMFDSYPDS